MYTDKYKNCSFKVTFKIWKLWKWGTRARPPSVTQEDVHTTSRFKTARGRFRAHTNERHLLTAHTTCRRQPSARRRQPVKRRRLPWTSGDACCCGVLRKSIAVVIGSFSTEASCKMASDEKTLLLPFTSPSPTKANRKETFIVGLRNIDVYRTRWRFFYTLSQFMSTYCIYFRMSMASFDDLTTILRASIYRQDTVMR